MPDYIKVTISYPIQHEQRSERSPEACSPALAEQRPPRIFRSQNRGLKTP